jgi:hypothetical protein
LATALQPAVLVAGSQIWQGLPGLSSPANRQMPLMKQIPAISGDVEHSPVFGLQVPAVWQASGAEQVTLSQLPGSRQRPSSPTTSPSQHGILRVG